MPGHKPEGSRWSDDWSWDYEESAQPPYWHIYSDIGTVLSFMDDCATDEERERFHRFVHAVVIRHNEINRRT